MCWFLLAFYLKLTKLDKITRTKSEQQKYKIHLNDYAYEKEKKKASRKKANKRNRC